MRTTAVVSFRDIALGVALLVLFSSAVGAGQLQPLDEGTDAPVLRAVEDEASETPSEQGAVEQATVEQVAADGDTAEPSAGADQAPAPATETPTAKTETGPPAPQLMPVHPTTTIILPSSGDSPAETEESTEPAKAAEQPLVPIPDPLEAGPVEIEAASFKGVTPGVTNLAEVEKAWGTPKEIKKQGGVLMQLYSVEPFDRVEVTFVQDKVASVVIRFDGAYPANAVAEQLELTNVRPVFVSNALGEILGQVYPERGVAFAFEPADSPGKASMKVVQIVLEPISAEPFVLRAETALETHRHLSLQDLEQALKLQPNDAKAHWLLCRVLMSMGKYDKAAEAGTSAVRLEPANSRYRATRAQALGQAGHIAEAIKEAHQVVKSSQRRPHIKARALCLLGDLLASGDRPDYKQAIRYHMEAASAAESLTLDKHPAIRIAAKRTLIDAHLGAAHDIAWGDWKEKDTAVSAWLERASAATEDLIKNEGASQQHRLHLGTRALAACVGLNGRTDPEKWADQALEAGDQLIAASNDRSRKAKLQWDVGMALYDTLQIYQMRGDREMAIKCGEVAISYLEQAKGEAPSPEADYLLGRLNFRLGAIHAIRGNDHQAAVDWFDKALALLDKPRSPNTLANMGRHGETLVSMGVSYWEVGQREKAVSLTENGVSIMEAAVQQGTLRASALSVPYGNLASMHRQLGSDEKAERFERLANRKHDADLR